MPDINDIYQSNSQWLRASDLQGTKPVVTIEGVEMSEFKERNGTTKQQIVLRFVGKDKKLGLNLTNARRIADLIGSGNTDDWVGYSIKLYSEKVEFNGQMVDAIRIFPDLPEQNGRQAQAASAQFAPPQHTGPNVNVPPTPKADDDIPF